MIGIRATAAAAAMVTILIDMARMASVMRTNTAIVPVSSKSPIADASAIINPITLRRWRRLASDSRLGDDFFN